MIIIVICGATGAFMGIDYANYLTSIGKKVSIIISDHAQVVFNSEKSFSRTQNLSKNINIYKNKHIGADIASGSFYFEALVVLPATMNFLAKASQGISDNLSSRIFDVAEKERRKIIISPRETPLSTNHLRNMLNLSERGAKIVPFMPSFYTNKKQIKDYCDYFYLRLNDQLGIIKEDSRRWNNHAK